MTAAEALVGDERHGDAGVDDGGIAEHAVERLAAASAPTGNAHAAEVDEGVLAGQILDGAGLILAGEGAHLAVDALAPLAAARGVGSAVVDAHHDVAQVGQVLVPGVAALPYILHGGAGGFAIDIDDDGVLLGGVEVDGLHQEGVQQQLAGAGLDELLRLQAESLELLAGLGRSDAVRSGQWG